MAKGWIRRAAHERSDQRIINLSQNPAALLSLIANEKYRQVR